MSSTTATVKAMIPEPVMAFAKNILAGAMGALLWAQQQDASTLALLTAGTFAAYVAISILTAENVPRVDVALTPEERAGNPGKKWKPGAGPHTSHIYFLSAQLQLPRDHTWLFFSSTCSLTCS